MLSLLEDQTVQENQENHSPQGSAPRLRPLKMTWGGNERHYQVLQREMDIVLVEATNHSGSGPAWKWRSFVLVNRIQRILTWPVLILIEVYPGNNAWGRLGWTWTPEQMAEAHFDFLVRGMESNFSRSAEYQAARKIVLSA